MRLGRWNTAAGLAALALVGSIVAVGAPAVSAERNRDHFRQADNAQPPAKFVAEYGGQLVVVSADNGRIDRHLTDERSKGRVSDPAVSPDGRRVWFSRAEGRCAAHLASVPAAGGREEQLPGSGEAGPEKRPLPRPGHPHLAYAREDCDKPRSALIVGDLSGVEGRGQSNLVPLAWNRTGHRLLAQRANGRETRLLEVNEAGAIVDSRPFEPADTTSGCRLEVVGFSPDDNGGYVAFRRCGPPDERGRRSLVLLDKDGTLRKTVVRISRGQAFTGRPAFDHSGHSLLFSTVAVQLDEDAARKGPKITLWLWRDGEVRTLDRGSRYRQPVWLP